MLLEGVCFKQIRSTKLLAPRDEGEPLCFIILHLRGAGRERHSAGHGSLDQQEVSLGSTSEQHVSLT